MNNLYKQIWFLAVVKKMIIVVVICFNLVGAENKEIVISASAQKQVNVTVYNNDLALIEDVRDVKLPLGTFTSAFEKVSSKIKPETAILNAKKILLLEQNFEYDLLSKKSLAKKFIGKDVFFKLWLSSEQFKIKPATILSVPDNHSVVLKSEGVFYSDISFGSIIYKEIPDNLRSEPTLTLLLDNKEVEKQTLSLSYLTKGMSWRADYVLHLNNDDELSLKSWVTLVNDSGINYSKANLSLVAGEINKVDNVKPFAMVKAVRNESYNSLVNTSSLFEYYLYSIERPIDIKNNQTKQLSLFLKPQIKYKKLLVIDANNHGDYRMLEGINEYEKLPVKNQIILDNTQDDGLGLALPEGVVRVYAEDKKGNTQFIGEDSLNHTPKNEKITLKLGESFDVTAKIKQTNYKKISSHSSEASYEVVFKNAKITEQVVRYTDSFSGEWEILDSSLPSQALNSRKNEWKVIIPAEGEIKLTYRIITHW